MIKCAITGQDQFWLQQTLTDWWVDALRLMSEGGLRHIPLVKNGRILGVVSRGDFKGLEQSHDEEERELWEHPALKMAI